MDKILPDERIDLQARGNNESLSLQKSIYDGSSIITSFDRGADRYSGQAPGIQVYGTQEG